MEEYFIIGQIINTQGLKGEVRVYPLTDFPDRFLQLKKVFLDCPEGLLELEIENVRYQKNFVILKFVGYNSIEEVEKWKNVYLQVHPEQAVKLPKGHYYIKDIVGMEVFTLSGKPLGQVVDVWQNTANDIYVVKNGIKEILLPAVKEVIKEINLAEKKIIIDPLEGLC